MTFTSAFERASAEYRKHLPDLTSPRFTTAKEQDPYSYCETFNTKQHPPWLYNLTQAWKELHCEPFKGVTADGNNPHGPN